MTRWLVALLLVLWSRPVRGDCPGLQVADFVTFRGTLHAGATCGAFVAESDGVDDLFSYGGFRLRQDIGPSFEVEVAVRRLSIDADKSIEIAVLGGRVLVRDGEIGFYTTEAQFEIDGWHPLHDLHQRDEHVVRVTQVGRDIDVRIDGTAAGHWRVPVAPARGNVGIGFKGMRGLRSRIEFHGLRVRPL
jgi:hypothetical protein